MRKELDIDIDFRYKACSNPNQGVNNDSELEGFMELINVFWGSEIY